MKQYIILIALSVFIISCKHDVRHYSGTVVDSSGTPIPQATVTINYRQGASNFSDGSEAIHTLAVTGIDGSFSSKLTLNKKEYINYFIIYTPAPNSKTLKTYEYNHASNTNMKIVIQ